MPNVYSIITQRIVELLEAGTVPWHKPWRGSWQAPKNLSTGKEYKGINLIVLNSAAFESPWWLTYKQTASRGGHVKKGEHGWPILFWKWVQQSTRETESNASDQAHSPTNRGRRGYPIYFTVFNVEQCDGIEYPTASPRNTDFIALGFCEKVVAEYRNPPLIENCYERAFYRPAVDLVGMPQPERFDRAEDYYSTLFHELSHSTGHSSRVARNGIMEHPEFASNDYSKEELVAEMGAAFLSGHCNIESKVLDNSAAYIGSWLSNLRKDSKIVVQAAAAAQKSSDHILNRKCEDEAREQDARQEVESSGGTDAKNK